MRLNLYLLFWILYATFIGNNLAFGQCDVSITSWDAVSGDIEIEIINSENCGCNELTSLETTCDNSSSPAVNNNSTVSHIVLGAHVPGMDYNWMDCMTGINHPGWTFKPWQLTGNSVLETGDTWSTNVFDTFYSNDCWIELLANDSLCVEVVVWQINLSRSPLASEGGWAITSSATQTQNYPDVDISNNDAIFCTPAACDTIFIETVEYIWDTVPIIEYIWDTIYTDIYYYETIYETDTIEVTEYVDVIDTLYVYEVDTIVETVIDSIFTEVVVYENVYVVDTITEFSVTTSYIDCSTGEPCAIGGDPCDNTSIYAPNAVTPNGDGWNDTWLVEAEGGCWSSWEVRIYNRWGGLVWISASSMDEWVADVATGVYVYTITAHSSITTDVIQFNGTITVLY